MYIDTGRFDALAIRRANEQQTEMLLKAELEHQYELMNSPDPQVRARALVEIERINALLG